MAHSMLGLSTILAIYMSTIMMFAMVPTVSPDSGATRNVWLIIPPGATGGFSGGINDSYGI